MEVPPGFSFVIEHKTAKYYAETGAPRMIPPNGQGLVEDMELAMTVSANPGIRVCRKAIPPGKTTMEIARSDLYTEEEAAELKMNGYADLSEVPWIEFLGHNYSGHKFTEVVILVPENVAQPKK